jgi:hypothetical protein
MRLLPASGSCRAATGFYGVVDPDVPERARRRPTGMHGSTIGRRYLLVIRFTTESA